MPLLWGLCVWKFPEMGGPNAEPKNGRALFYDDTHEKDSNAWKQPYSSCKDQP